VQGTAQIKSDIEQAKLDLEQARRAGDLTRMSELQHGVLPDLERQLASADEVQAEPTLLRSRVTEDEVAEVVSRWTGIPVAKRLEGDREKLLRMEETLHARVVGQDEAVTAVSHAVRRARAGLADPQRPNGSFLFLGPTGVGKTELCKALADYLFDSEQAMVRIDMSEFMEKHSVARLIGAPPGYVGYEEGGYLTEAVRRRPYSLLLLDEVEKAHPDVFNILLQVLEDGRLTDGQGRTVDFRNTVVVMTSNLGSEHIRDAVDQSSQADIQAAVMHEVEAHFRPEFLNRIDESVVFHALNEAHIGQIAMLQLTALMTRLKERSLGLVVNDEVRAYLAEQGFDPVYGARPLKRAIQRLIENPLAQALLTDQFAPGDVIEASMPGQQIVFAKAGEISRAA
jgi:ATP-dependent Clp protease ATP-binding subunit ClpB